VSRTGQDWTFLPSSAALVKKRGKEGRERERERERERIGIILYNCFEAISNVHTHMHRTFCKSV